jgi:hypothetical protein
MACLYVQGQFMTEVFSAERIDPSDLETRQQEARRNSGQGEAGAEALRISATLPIRQIRPEHL